MRYLIAIPFIFLLSCSSKESFPEITFDNIPSNEVEFQKMVLKQITGEAPIKVTERGDQYINSRWSSKEKNLTIDYLKSLIKYFGLVPLEHSYNMPNLNSGIDLLIEPLKGKNLYTTLSSTTKSDEFIILGAHYDTDKKNVPGALDNGSGMALILSILKRATQLEFRNKNLLIVFFDQEEEDISAGSVAFAEYLLKNNYKIHSVHTFDLIGWDGDNNKEVELELPRVEIEKIYKKHAKLLNIPIYVSNANSSDHFSFIKQGINAVGVSQAISKGDNSGKKDTPDDKFHLVNFEYLNSSTNLALEVIKELMND